MKIINSIIICFSPLYISLSLFSLFFSLILGIKDILLDMDLDTILMAHQHMQLLLMVPLTVVLMDLHMDLHTEAILLFLLTIDMELRHMVRQPVDLAMVMVMEDDMVECMVLKGKMVYLQD